MGVIKHWPLGQAQPFGVVSDHSWAEIGALFRMIDEHHVTLFIETGVGRGDLAAWMVAKCNFDADFQYLGITNDPNAVDTRIRQKVGERAFISAGAACSQPTLRRVGSLIRNARVAMVLCNGIDIGKEVDQYLSILRPGDLIVAHQFLTKYMGRRLMDMDRNGQLERLSGNWITPTRFIAGVIK